VSTDKKQPVRTSESLGGIQIRPSQSSYRRTLAFPWDYSTPTEPRSLAEPLTETHPDPQVLWQSQKLESLGLMAGGVAHDFNNYLLAIMGNADLLDQEIEDVSAQQPLVTEIRAAAQRAGDLCNQLLAFAGKGQFHIQPMDLSATIDSMVRMLKVGISRKIALRLELAADLPLILADPSQIQQVLMNLVVNASEAVGDKTGVITVRTGVRDPDECCFEQCIVAPQGAVGSFVCLEVIDSGSGMDVETMNRAFDPFYSTKHQGRGLGLASVLGIVRSHRGSVGVSTAPAEGTTVTILLPQRGVARPDVESRPVREATRGRGTILVVDDDKYLRVLCKRMLSHLGYEVVLADGGPEALEICRERGAELDCVMLDLIMPVLDGAEVFAELRRLYPELKVLLTSGYHEMEISRRFAGQGLAGFLQKPYVLGDLSRKLNEVLNPQAEPAPPSAG
jgi:two-component system cell cycle sensor histidine kinase/response regulator CckA